MGNFFNGLKRFLMAVLNILTLGLLKLAKKSEDSPDVAEMEMEGVIRKKVETRQKVVQNVATVMADQQNRKTELQKIEEQEAENEKLKQLAHKKMMERAKQLKQAGKTKEEAVADAEYQKHRDHYQKFKEIDDDLEARLAQLKQAVEAGEQTLKQYQAKIRKLTEDINKTKQLKNRVVTDMRLAKADKEAASAINNIDADDTSATMNRIMSRRDQMVAEATLADQMSGAADERARDEYLEELNQSSVDDEALAMFDDEPAPAETEKPAAAVPSTPTPAETEKSAPAEAVNADRTGSDPLPE